MLGSLYWTLWGITQVLAFFVGMWLFSAVVFVVWSIVAKGWEVLHR